MSGLERAVAVCLVGWSLWVMSLLAVLAEYGFGDGENVYVAVGITLAVAMGAWIRMSGGRASLITATVLGSLLVLQSIGYVIGSVSSDPIDWTVLATDAVALGAGTLIVLGAVMALRSRSTSLATV